MPFYVKYDDNPTLLSDEVVVPDFDRSKFAVYSKKLIKQDVYFNVPLPEGMTFEEADKLRLDTDVFNLINQCGEPVFDSYGDRYYYPDNDEIWSAYSYDEPIVPLKVDYLNAIAYEG